MIKILLRINGRGNACQEILDETQLEKWITRKAAKKNIPTRFIVPKVVETFLLCH